MQYTYLRHNNNTYLNLTEGQHSRRVYKKHCRATSEFLTVYPMNMCTNDILAFHFLRVIRNTRTYTYILTYTRTTSSSYFEKLSASFLLRKRYRPNAVSFRWCTRIRTLPSTLWHALVPRLLVLYSYSAVTNLYAGTVLLAIMYERLMVGSGARIEHRYGFGGPVRKCTESKVRSLSAGNRT